MLKCVIIKNPGPTKNKKNDKLRVPILVSDGTGTLNVIVFQKNFPHVKPETLAAGLVRINVHITSFFQTTY